MARRSPASAAPKRNATSLSTFDMVRSDGAETHKLCFAPVTLEMNTLDRNKLVI